MPDTKDTDTGLRGCPLFQATHPIFRCVAPFFVRGENEGGALRSIPGRRLLPCAREHR